MVASAHAFLELVAALAQATEREYRTLERTRDDAQALVDRPLPVLNVQLPIALAALLEAPTPAPAMPGPVTLSNDRDALMAAALARSPIVPPAVPRKAQTASGRPGTLREALS